MSCGIGCQLRTAALLRCHLPFGKINNLSLQAGLVEPINFLHPGWAGDIDLGQVVANDVEADEIQPVPLEKRSNGSTDLLIAVGYIRLDAGSTHMDIAPIFIGPRHPQGTADGFTVQGDETFVALTDFRDILLGNDGLATVLGQRFRG